MGPGFTGKPIFEELYSDPARLEQFMRALELDLGLGLAGLERLGQLTPEPIGSVVAHLEEPSDVAGAVLVEERRRLGAVAVAPVGPLPIAIEEAQRDQRVEKVVDRPRMKPEPCTGFLTRHRRPA
jgi:hypothetical protein